VTWYNSLRSADVCCFAHKRPISFYQPGVLSHPYFSCMEPSCWPKPITPLLHNPTLMSFCSPSSAASHFVKFCPRRCLQSILDILVYDTPWIGMWTFLSVPNQWLLLTLIEDIWSRTEGQKIHTTSLSHTKSHG
jgi:hypothetical protein